MKQMKTYRWKDKIYCEEDLSEEIGDDYGGNLINLYIEMERDGILIERTTYVVYFDGDYSDEYEDIEEMIKEEYANIVDYYGARPGDDCDPIGYMR